MAAAPSFKIYDSSGKYQAAVHELEAGACLMSLYGDGATIRYGHATKDILWTEGQMPQPAAESYDYVADFCSGALRAKRGRFGGALAEASRHRA